MTDPTSRREEIARIIDPEAFEKPRYDNVSARRMKEHAVKSALSKADAILASDGGREMVRELVEALGRLLSIARMEWRTERVDDARKAARMAHAKAKEWLEGNKS